MKTQRTMVVAAIAGLMLLGCARDADQGAREARVAAAGVDSGPAFAPAASDASLLLMVEAAPEPQPPQAETVPEIGLGHDCVGHVDHLARARELREQGDTAGGLLEARRALHHEASSEALEEAALLARRQGERELAMRIYAALAAKVPAEALPLIKLARLAAEGRDWEAVRTASVEAILRDPTASEAYHLRGRASLNQQNLTGALRDFRKAAALDPGHGWSLNNLGYAYLLANQPESALEPLEEAARLMPGEAKVLNNLGIALEKAGRTEEAGEAYAAALALKPDYVKAIVNKARLTQLASAANLPSVETLLPADGLDLEGAPLPSDSGLELLWQDPESDLELPGAVFEL